MAVLMEQTNDVMRASGVTYAMRVSDATHGIHVIDAQTSYLGCNPRWDSAQLQNRLLAFRRRKIGFRWQLHHSAARIEPQNLILLRPTRRLRSEIYVSFWNACRRLPDKGFFPLGYHHLPTLCDCQFCSGRMAKAGFNG